MMESKDFTPVGADQDSWAHTKATLLAQIRKSREALEETVKARVTLR